MLTIQRRLALAFLWFVLLSVEGVLAFSAGQLWERSQQQREEDIEEDIEEEREEDIEEVSEEVRQP